MSVLTERLRAQTEEHLADEQAGFRKDRSTVQQILNTISYLVCYIKTFIARNE